MHGLLLWEPRPRGEALGAEPAPFAAGRGSHKKRATCTTQRHARAQFVGGPPSGRSFGHRAGDVRRGSRLPQKARAPCRAALCTDRICRSPALGAKLFGHRAGAVRRGSRLPQKSARPARRSAMHGLNLWEARPRGEALGTELAPFAASRGSHRKACDRYRSTPCTDCFCGRPAVGAKLWAPSRCHSPRVAPPTKKSAQPA